MRVHSPGAAPRLALASPVHLAVRSHVEHGLNAPASWRRSERAHSRPHIRRHSRCLSRALVRSVAFIAQSNSIATTAALAVYCLLLVLLLMIIAAILSHPYWGYFVALVIPFFVITLNPLIAGWYVECIKRQHDEVVELLGGVPASDARAASHSAAAGAQLGQSLTNSATLIAEVRPQVDLRPAASSEHRE